MEKLAELCFKQLQLDTQAQPWLRRLYPDDGVILRTFQEYGLETADGFLDLLSASSPPSPSWFSTYSLPIEPGYFGVYVLLFDKISPIPRNELLVIEGADGQLELDDVQPLVRADYKLYGGKGSGLYRDNGVWSRLQGYLGPNPNWSIGCRAAINDGFRLRARSLVARWLIPPQPYFATTLLLDLEATICHAFGMNESGWSKTPVAEGMLLWPDVQLPYTGCNRSSALREAKDVLAKLDLAPEEVTRTLLERKQHHAARDKQWKEQNREQGVAVCPRCQHAFSDRHELDVHLERAKLWQAKEFPCPVCCSGFAKFGTRSTHVKKFHPDAVEECRRLGIIAQTHSTALKNRWARGDFD